MAMSFNNNNCKNDTKNNGEKIGFQKLKIKYINEQTNRYLSRWIWKEEKKLKTEKATSDSEKGKERQSSLNCEGDYWQCRRVEPWFRNGSLSKSSLWASCRRIIGMTPETAAIRWKNGSGEGNPRPRERNNFVCCRCRGWTRQPHTHVCIMLFSILFIFPFSLH